MTARKQSKPRNEPYSNRIPMPFEKAVEGLLSVKPKRKTTNKKKKKK